MTDVGKLWIERIKGLEQNAEGVNFGLNQHSAAFAAMEKRIADLEEDSHPPVAIDLEGFNTRITDLEEKLKGMYIYQQSKYAPPLDTEPAKTEPDLKALKRARKEARDKLILAAIDCQAPYRVADNTLMKPAIMAYEEANDAYQDARKCP